MQEASGQVRSPNRFTFTLPHKLHINFIIVYFASTTTAAACSTYFAIVVPSVSQRWADKHCSAPSGQTPVYWPYCAVTELDQPAGTRAFRDLSATIQSPQAKPAADSESPEATPPTDSACPEALPPTDSGCPEALPPTDSACPEVT